MSRPRAAIAGMVAAGMALAVGEVVSAFGSGGDSLMQQRRQRVRGPGRRQPHPLGDLDPRDQGQADAARRHRRRQPRARRPARHGDRPAPVGRAGRVRAVRRGRHRRRPARSPDERRHRGARRGHGGRRRQHHAVDPAPGRGHRPPVRRRAQRDRRRTPGRSTPRSRRTAAAASSSAGPVASGPSPGSSRSAPAAWPAAPRWRRPARGSPSRRPSQAPAPSWRRRRRLGARPVPVHHAQRRLLPDRHRRSWPRRSTRPRGR